MRWWLVLGAVGLCSASCHLVVSFDDPLPTPDLAQPIVPPEDCENGSDDDGDGLADCADPDCQVDHECVLVAPSGFQLTLATSGVEPTCPDGSSPTTLQGSGTPVCDASNCACGMPTGACTVSATMFSSACQGGSANTFTMVPGACYSTMGTGTSGLFTGNSASVACAATGSSTVTTPAMPAPVSFCATPPASGGCDPEHVCLKRTPAPFAQVCVVAAGTQACPSDRPRRQILGNAISDQRTCTCDCSSSTSCALTSVEVRSAASCTGISQTVIANGKCKVFDSQSASMRMSPSAMPGPCTPTAIATGPLSATTPRTLCCPP